MKSAFFFAGMIALSSVFAVSCGAPGGGNAQNRPANVANAANTNTGANSSTASAEADVKRLMNDLAGILAKNDADAASKFYADDYHLVTPDGVDQTKTERLADMRSGATKFDSFAYENVNIRAYGDTAVAIATVKARGIVGGKPRTNDMRATLVFRKMADGWKVVSGQATPIASTTPAPNTNTAGTASTKSVSNSNRY